VLASWRKYANHFSGYPGKGIDRTVGRLDYRPYEVQYFVLRLVGQRGCRHNKNAQVWPTGTEDDGLSDISVGTDRAFHGHGVKLFAIDEDYCVVSAGDVPPRLGDSRMRLEQVLCRVRAVRLVGLHL